MAHDRKPPPYPFPAVGCVWQAKGSTEVADGTALAAMRRSKTVMFKDESEPAVADNEALADQRGVRGLRLTRLTEPSSTAVADGETPEPEPVEMTPPVVDLAGLDSDSDSAAHSIAGDTAVDSETDGGADDTAVADSRRQQRLAPKTPVQGSPTHGHSSKHNSEPEVGNFGLFFGNWGLRGTVGGNDAAKLRRDTQDRQILKSPGQVVVVVEASRELEELLRLPAVAAEDSAQGGLQGRSTHEHFVVRGDEQSAVLIAARTDNTTSLECLMHEVHDDHEYREKGKLKIARSRMLVGKVGFKQNIGHLGTNIVVCGVHGHYRTMKMEWPQAWNAFWDRLAEYVRTFSIQFLAGDFNMSFTEVPKQLRNRGILCDCVAWYPWQQAGDTRAAVAAASEQRLGFDSCGIFCIGGSVQVSTPWSLQHIDILAAVAGDHPDLDVYEGTNVPGQPWACYRSRTFNERPTDKDLKARLRDLLTPSTTTEELENIPRREGKHYCPYLRLKQKPMNKNEWLVGGIMHNGAHFPLCVFTNNSSARSEEAVKMRNNRLWEKKGKGAKGRKGSWESNRPDTAVAENAYSGKGPKGSWENYRPDTAVAQSTYFGKPLNKGKGARSYYTADPQSR